MILEKSTGYWATGIALRWRNDTCTGWAGTVEFFDDGWIGDDDADTGHVSTEGVLRTRYEVTDGPTASGLATVIDVLLADAERLGITFHATPDATPHLWYVGDGETRDYPPPTGWRAMLREQAERIAWATYGTADASP